MKASKYILVTSMLCLALGAHYLWDSNEDTKESVEPKDLRLVSNTLKSNTLQMQINSNEQAIVGEKNLQVPKNIPMKKSYSQKSVYPHMMTSQDPNHRDLMPEITLESLPPGSTEQDLRRAKAQGFFNKHLEMLGLNHAEQDLSERATQKDFMGYQHTEYRQNYKGVPVIGGTIISHFDVNHQLYAVNSTLVPNIDLDVNPYLEEQAAIEIALNTIAQKYDSVEGLSSKVELRIYDTGSTQPIEGVHHLVHHVRAQNGFDKDYIVMVDAHTGEVVADYNNRHGAFEHRIYDLDGGETSDIPSIYPDSPVWVLGDSIPYTNPGQSDFLVNEVNLAIRYTPWVYELMYELFDKDSPNGQGSPMDDIVNWNFFNFNAFNACDSETANSPQFSVFTSGLVTDDIVAHEWGHCYHSYSTGGFVYFGQSGAIAEGISDIIGDTVDIVRVDKNEPYVVEETRQPIRQHNPDGEGGERCSIVSDISGTTPIPNKIKINSPSSIESEHWGGGLSAFFGTNHVTIPKNGFTGDVVLVDDGTDTATDGCEPILNDVSGKIALIDRGVCGFETKILNAQDAGAGGVIIADHTDWNDIRSLFVSTDVIIPAIGVTKQVGDKLKSEINNPPNVTLKLGPIGLPLENSYRWLQAEEPIAAIVRDLWNPHCDGEPNKVSDTDFYVCNPSNDGAGVHQNSPIIAHTFSMLADGKQYNDQNVRGIGLTKAFYIFYHALDAYNTQTTNFSEYADNLEQACQDLLGYGKLKDVKTFNLTSPMKPSDCQQLSKAILATELRETPECYQ